MAQDLPDDVWSQLAETWLDQGALQSMSLTSRRMHRFVVPVLFRCLEFHMFRAGSESAIVRLIRNNMRARFLFNSPELLRHTRSFTFWEHLHAVDLVAEYLAQHEESDPDDPFWRLDAEKFIAVLHDSIFRLIFRIPGLREIRIGDSVMTPLCYAAISSRLLRTSLGLEPRILPDITHVTTAPPHAFRLRDFVCYCDAWTDYGTWTNTRVTDPYLADILDHCILGLEKLTMSSILLPLVVSRIPLHRTLSLRTLSVDFPNDPKSSDSLAVTASFHVLHVCPQLRHLSLLGGFPDIEPTHYLPPPSLPDLSTFSGPSRLLQILSRGTNIMKIEIYDKFYIKEQPLTQVILSSPTHLRELFMRLVVFSRTPHEFLRFIRSLTVFQDLERLDISYELDISWKSHVSAQDSHSTIKDLLHQLPCLRVLTIHSWYYAVDGYDIGCPISKQGEPADRGRPSLERIYVDFIRAKWFWDPRTGWEQNNFVTLQHI